MTTVAWIVVVLICLAGGIWLGRYTAPGVEKTRSLEQERDEAHAELQRYREDVRTHFEKTAHLFNQVTGSYRSLYEHLAEGSERLGTGPSAGMLESKPEDRTLQGPEQAGADGEGAGQDATEEPGAADAPAAEESADTGERPNRADEPAESTPEAGTEPQAEQPREPEQEPEPDEPHRPAADYSEESDRDADDEDRRDEAKRA